ncbi:uncharacterized protein BDZ99DRAFT_519127 [Mytilinidion resinicola]|uniref:F-box domain-containing protein n=1 Tax=Mytilinidion resinicola TaxID=574789 RepID=A0A6A6YV81_9PEZI|nr:uncharacterized protein BDZ99DRAFT_519127 [Mytilinidion resinicola]KAF2811885.1 hypothetical protein BDZ99DRAFT_519127 [Mytilinidion resinicola]
MEPSAAHRVLGIIEFLELILLELPVFNIFQAQRVSKQWNTVICNSSPLQQAMWLAPLVPASLRNKEHPNLFDNFYDEVYDLAYDCKDPQFTLYLLEEKHMTWKEMRVCNPSCTRLTVRGQFWELGVLDNETGVRMGDVMRLIGTNWIWERDIYGVGH